jgi:hypothetical protein
MTSIFALLGFLFLLGAVAPTTLRFGSVPELWLLCLWPASVYLLVATIYAVDPSLGVLLIAKRADRDADGGLPMWALVLFAPFFVIMWGVWFVRHTTCVPLSGEAPFDRVADGLYVGRWPLRFPSEFPADCPNWIDLTAEFPARRSVLRGRRYVCLPSMDCTLPDNESLISLAVEAAGWDGDIYISCANGHGRSACLAALIMLVRGLATSWEDAFQQMRKNRTSISIQRNQVAIMHEIDATMRARGLVAAARGRTTLSAKGVIELTDIGKQELRAGRSGTFATAPADASDVQQASQSNVLHTGATGPYAV